MWCVECGCDTAAIGSPGERRCGGCGAELQIAGSPLRAAAAAGVELGGIPDAAPRRESPISYDDWELARGVRRLATLSDGRLLRFDQPDFAGRESRNEVSPRRESGRREATQADAEYSEATPGDALRSGARSTTIRGAFGWLGGLFAIGGVVAAFAGLAGKWLLELGVALPTAIQPGLAPRVFESGVAGVLIAGVFAARRLARNQRELATALTNRSSRRSA